MNRIRSILFTAVYYVVSILYVLLAALFLALPGRKAVGWIVRRYARRMVQAMWLFAGIKLKVVGREKVPAACIIAAKHHSWFDGFSCYSQFDDMAFVTGDHLEKVPLLSGVLHKLGAIVVDSCGGHKARASLQQNAAKANEEGRRILIYPEGHLAKAGERFRYKTGVYHMYKNFGLPVVPAATNLGVFAPQQGLDKFPGTATLQFLDPIPPGLSKADFMKRLEDAIEGQSDILIAEACRQPVVPSKLVPDPLTFAQAMTQLS
jgi:1-acyl-sn-glycerol-3-phosphate acyltransferase